MKIEHNSYWKENSDDRKNNRAGRAAEARRQNAENAEQAAKSKQAESPLKDELKFAGILKSATNPQKLKQTEDDSSQQQRDDDKKEKRRAEGQKNASDNLTGGDRIEKRDQSNGGQFGGGGGFGAGGGISQTVNLSENFAARSILHIADLERMISAIRTQTALGGRREIYLELKRSVLEGLRVKITTDADARVQIEFLAANEKVRLQIESHSEELAEILRGRGINLQSLRTVVNSEFSENPVQLPDKGSESDSTEELSEQNTFETENETPVYRA